MVNENFMQVQSGVIQSTNKALVILRNDLTGVPKPKFRIRELVIIKSQHNDAAFDFEWNAKKSHVKMLKLFHGDGFK